MAITAQLALQIAERDRWHCRYTGEPVVLSVWFQAHSMVDSTFKYNKNHRGDATDPLAITNTLQIDHFVALANKGTDDPANLFTSCARANIRKGKSTTWSLLPIIADAGGWDGGVSEFIALVDKHPETLRDPMVARWYRAATARRQ